jgi:hypothetical protein
MKNSNIILYFYSVSERNIKHWNQLIYELSFIFDNVICVISSDVKSSKLFSNRATIINEDETSFFARRKYEVQNGDIFKDNSELYDLIKHPEFSRKFRILRFIPHSLSNLIIKRIILKKMFFFKKILVKYQATHLMIMEPKNFLYSTSVVLLELLCKKYEVAFNFIHGSFFINNIKIFNNLNRHEEELYVKYKSIQLTKQNINEVDVFIDKYKKFLFKELTSYLIGNGKTTNKKIYSEENTKPYILFMDSKPGNYRSHYVNPGWKPTDIVKALKYIPDQYDFVYKIHPKARNMRLIKALEKHQVKIITNDYDNFSLISRASIVITNVSHSFVDAMLLDKRVVILGKYNYLFSYEEGPFIKIPDMEFFGKKFNQIINERIDTNGIKKLFYLIHQSIDDGYFDLERTIERFNNNGIFFDCTKSVQMIVAYYKDQLLK